MAVEKQPFYRLPEYTNPVQPGRYASYCEHNVRHRVPIYAQHSHSDLLGLLQMRASNNELSSFFRFLLKKLLIGIRELIN